LGSSWDEHYLYFETVCRGKVGLKEMLELRHYVGRATAQKQLEQQFGA
jgi:hypothetical protein